MAHHSTPVNVLSGFAKLSQDISILVNNPQGSDFQFKVGGSTILPDSGETIFDSSAAVTLYAHSLILRCRSRYFASMFDEDKHLKESSGGVFYSRFSCSTLLDVLHYIYTGNIRIKDPENTIELILAADEMELEELSTKYQSELLRVVKFYFSDKNESSDDNESREKSEESANPHVPMDTVIYTHIIPALNLTGSNSLSQLSQKLLAIMLPRMSVIFKSPDAYTALINGISSNALDKLIESDNLAVKERSVWDLVLKWGCHQTQLSKTTVETHLNKLASDEENDEASLDVDETVINATQLSQLKVILAPRLPAIRFSILDPEDFISMINILSYFLSRRRFLELTRFFYHNDGTVLLDTPRGGQKNSMIVVKLMAWEQLRKNIFETGSLNCPTLNHLKFELLFRASEHGFSATTFHQRCDYKGPTLVLVRSADGHLFGGVNFTHWTSNNDWSLSPLNFLFALPDGHHRKDWAIFRIEDQNKAQQATFNPPSYGPTFGCGCDLYIADFADTNEFSYSKMPNSYSGSGASNTALAGAKQFRVSNYEVFSITY